MRNNQLQIEGSTSSKLVQLIRQLGFNQEMTIEVGKVVSVSPISIHLESDNLVLDSDDLIMSEHLTEHTRLVEATTSDGGKLTQITFKNALKPGNQVIVIGDEETQLYYVFDKVGEL